MNVTTWRREGPADLGLAVDGPAELSARQPLRRRGRGMLPGIALSAVLHAAVLALVLFAVANPFIGFPTDGDEGIVRVSLVTVTAGPDNGAPAPPEAKTRQVRAAKADPVAVQKAMENTVIAEAADRRAAERQEAVTSIAVEPARLQASAGRGTAAGEAARGQRQAGSAQEGYSEAMPRYRENRPPVYPGLARQRGYEGDVLIAAEVRSDGRIGAARIKRSSGYASLDQSALDAVRGWRFEPARRMGSPVDAWVEIPIRFKLSPHDSFM